MNKLISKVKNKEQFAITKLYNDNINKIYFICKELVQNEEVALDLSQDIFMTIINKIDTLNDYNKYYAWQKAIAINKCKDYLKRNKELLFIDEEQEEALMQVEEIDDTYVPHKYIIKKETRNMIMDIINTKLSDKQRIAVLLFYYNDMKCSEIAEYFECAEGTVKSRLNSARKIIKMEIEKLQEKGVKVRSNAILPLLVFLLEEEARDNKLSKVVKNELLSNILNGTLTSVTKMCMGGLISTKVMAIIAIGTTLVVGGGAAVYKNYLSNNEAKVISQNDVIQENDKTIVDETDKIEDDLEQKEEKKVDTNKNEETVVIDGKEVKIYEEVERDIKSNTNNQEQKPQTPSTPEQKPQTPQTPSTPEQKPQTPSTPEQKPQTPSTTEQKPQTPSTPEQKPQTPSKPEQKPQVTDWKYDASLSAQLQSRFECVSSNNYGQKNSYNATCTKTFLNKFFSISDSYFQGNISQSQAETQIKNIDGTEYHDKEYCYETTEIYSVSFRDFTVSSLTSVNLYCQSCCFKIAVYTNGSGNFRIKHVLVGSSIRTLEDDW